jgi:hypothetical protein
MLRAAPETGHLARYQGQQAASIPALGSQKTEGTSVLSDVVLKSAATATDSYETEQPDARLDDILEPAELDRWFGQERSRLLYVRAQTSP